jgi:transcriptional regulator with XRE-family HTH domain
MRDGFEDVKVLVTLLRRLRGWSQAEMAARSGVNKSSLSEFEKGKAVPARATLEKLATAAGVPMWVVDGALAPVLALARQALVGAAGLSPERMAALDDASRGELSAAERIALAQFLGAAVETGDEPAAAAGEQDDFAAADRWTFLPHAACGIPALPAELGAAFERLVECACAESRRTAAHDARQALALARLARQVAELAPGAAAWRSGLQSKAWAFEANALRAAAELRAADAALAASWKLRQLAGSAAEAIFPEWRLLDLEASLRREQRRFARALELHDRALGAAPGEACGRILLNKASTLEQAGQVATALAVLAEAAPLLEAAGEARERMGVRFHTTVNLWHLGRLREAAASLAELRPLVLALGNDLDLLRFRWLGARVAAGLGRREEALAEYAAVRGEFARRANAYDAALVGLDAAVLHLEQGDSREVATLAQEMLWIFGAQQLHREALVALRLFQEAAARRAATEDLARRVRDYLERARHDPRPFEMAPSGRRAAARRRRRPASGGS